MPVNKETSTRRLALAISMVDAQGGANYLDALDHQARQPIIDRLYDEFRAAEHCGRDAARGWIAKALRRERDVVRKSSGTAPDTSLHLGNDRREWLIGQGGIQPTIQRLIDEAMGK